MNIIADDFKFIADLPTIRLVSEEDVKIKVVLPLLRTLGYVDGDFNFEGRTARGYVDVVVERFLTGIVVEAKAPGKRLDGYTEQVENYVFHKHAPERATIAILTDGEFFNIYGIAGAFWRGSLDSFRILSFKRSEIGNPGLVAQLANFLAKDNNEKGTIPEAISSFRMKRQDRLGAIEAELRDCGPNFSEWVFPNFTNRRHPLQNGGRKAWAKTLTKAGLPLFPIYYLRHTLASRLTTAGVSPLTIAQMLGHSSTQIVPRYAQVMDQNRLDAMKKLEGLRQTVITSQETAESQTDEAVGMRH